MHLDLAVDRLIREFGIPLNVGPPNVAYRETISWAVNHDYTEKRRVERSPVHPAGPYSQFARIRFRIEPNPGAGFVFLTSVPGGSVLDEFIPAVRKGVESVIAVGPIIGFPILDVKFTLTDGAYHDVDSSEVAFELAGRTGFLEAFSKAGPQILEPVMAVDVVVPWEHAAEAVAYLKLRRGVIRAADTRLTNYFIEALVPVAGLFGFTSSLRTLTSGHGRHTSRFDHYAVVPNAIGPNGDGPYDSDLGKRA